MFNSGNFKFNFNYNFKTTPRKMSENEILNLIYLCRGCHASGQFKSLGDFSDGAMLSVLFQETFGINILPPTIEASYSLCDVCIEKLQDASNFKKQVLDCENKFEVYCKNEILHKSMLKDEFRSSFGNDDRDGFEEKKDPDLTRKEGCIEDDIIREESDIIMREENDIIIRKENDIIIREENDILIREENDIIIREENDIIIREENDIIISEGNNVTQPNDITEQKEKQTEETDKKSSNGIARLSAPLWTTLVYKDENDIQSCILCPKSYKMSANLEKHIMEKHLNTEGTCDVCGVYFKSDDYKKHLVEHPKTYECKLCKKRFKHVRSFRFHVNIHTKNESYKCEHCNKLYLHFSTYKRHVRTKHCIGNLRKHLCDRCNYSATTKKILKIHIKKEHYKIREFICDICSKSFKIKSDLLRHVNKHPKIGTSLEWMSYVYKDEDGRQSCALCTGFYKKTINLEKHIMEKHLNTEGLCKVCGVYFASADYKKHLKEHPKTYKCKICKKNFKSLYSFKAHVNVHTKNILYKCQKCNKIYLNVLSFKYHLRKHDGFIRKYFCDKCGLTANDITHLNAHIRTVHDKIRDFVCDVCSKSFTAKSHLLKHMSCHFHNGDPLCTDKIKVPRVKTRTCRLCDLKFQGQRAYTYHMKIHEDYRDFVCSQCGAEFLRKSSLKRHILHTHIGLPKNLVCDICGFKASVKGALNKHVRKVHDPTKSQDSGKVRCELCQMRVHNIKNHMKSHEIRPYKCEQCNLHYPGKKGLARHNRTIHPPVTCTICSKPYTKAETLKRHMLAVHKAESASAEKKFKNEKINPAN